MPLFLLFLPLLASAADLNGLWDGHYTYGNGKTVQFTARICFTGKTFRGNSVEPATFGDGSSPVLKAGLSGSLDGSTLTFRKTYDGTGGVSHSVDYSAEANGGEVKGKWKLEGGDGPFEMKLQPGTSEAAGCKPKEQPQQLLMQ